MSRKRRAPKRIFLTDTKYKSNLILKFMNSIMYDGKKTIAEKIVYEALDKLQLKLNQIYILYRLKKFFFGFFFFWT